ncbi:predicted protein [Nematostella vectensis]|uniref:Uncharacterized protein n=1 Tax=Nematostella vectensis TaxID=45351 RepID=A7S8P0_NEMVE|nr:large neutral amino acids transporter small subunit 3 [Nematostella vectensis]EDO39904.1 predicted protein [Nematostella vectensis]|eukprot:XP_001631967.1 predicted protein [Nematostella vectensis]
MTNTGNTQLSSFRLWVLFVVSVVEMSLFASPLLGWSSLVFVLKGERVFFHLCPENVTRLVPSDNDELRGCGAQDDRLNLALTIACFVNAIMMFVMGWAIDRVGAKMVKILSSVLFAMSGGFLALTTQRTPMMLFATLLVMGVAYAGIYASITRGVTAFGKWQSVVNSAYNCAMQSSALTFLLVKMLYEHGVAYQTLCYGFVGACTALFLSSVVVFPNIQNNTSNSTTKPDKMSEAASGDLLGHMRRCVKELYGHVTGGVFVWTCLFLGLCRWRLWFFLASFQKFMEAQPGTTTETVRSYANYYGIIQMCSLAMCPMLGALIAAGRGTLSFKSLANACKRQGDKVTTKIAEEGLLETEAGVMKIHSHVTSTQTVCCAREVRGCMAAFGGSGVVLVAINVLALIPSVNLQLLTFTLISALRCFYNGGVSNLFLVAFPLEDYGKLMGISAIITAAIQALQYPTFVSLETVFDGDIIWLNTMFLVLSLPLSVGLPVFLWRYSRKLDRQAVTSPHDMCQTTIVVESIVYERLTVV